jgi:hypothetical protein
LAAAKNTAHHWSTTFFLPYFAEDDPDDVDFEPESDTEKAADKVIYWLKFMPPHAIILSYVLSYIVILLFKLGGLVVILVIKDSGWYLLSWNKDRKLP